MRNHGDKVSFLPPPPDFSFLSQNLTDRVRLSNAGKTATLDRGGDGAGGGTSVVRWERLLGKPATQGDIDFSIRLDQLGAENSTIIGIVPYSPESSPGTKTESGE